MANWSVSGVRLAGVASAVPEPTRSADDLAALFTAEQFSDDVKAIVAIDSGEAIARALTPWFEDWHPKLRIERLKETLADHGKLLESTRWRLDRISRSDRVDGLSATAFPSGVRNVPVEITEAITPIVVWKKEFRTDSGGPGRQRGGLGQVMEVTRREDAPFAIFASFERVTYPARGRDEGEAGALEPFGEAVGELGLGGELAEAAVAVVDRLTVEGRQLHDRAHEGQEKH